jgi:hypothetical protein
MDDKTLTNKLTDLGIEWIKAREVIGIIVELVQLADLDGYKRGFNDGWELSCKKKI